MYGVSVGNVWSVCGVSVGSACGVCVCVCGVSVWSVCGVGRVVKDTGSGASQLVHWCLPTLQ